MVKTSKNKNSAGGKKLASIPGYHALLSRLAHKQISKSTFKRKASLLLAKIKRPVKAKKK